MTYTIWLCCGEFEQEDTREDAIGLAAAMIGGDGHQVLAVEGPDGEDLLAEAEERDRQRSRQWLQQCKEQQRKLLGRIEVKGPTGQWWGRQYCYSPELRDSELAAHRATYGDDRVRWIPEAP